MPFDSSEEMKTADAGTRLSWAGGSHLPNQLRRVRLSGACTERRRTVSLVVKVFELTRRLLTNNRKPEAACLLE